MYRFKFAAICRTDRKNNIHHFSTIADSEHAARRQLSYKFVLFFQADVDKHVDVQPQQVGIEQGYLVANQAQFFHRLDPVETRGGRQVYRARKVRIGDARILLKAIENPDISSI